MSKSTDITFYQEDESGRVVETPAFPISPNYTILKQIINNAGLPEEEFLIFFKSKLVCDENLDELDGDKVNDLLADRGRLVKRSFFNSLSLWLRDNQKPKTVQQNETTSKKFSLKTSIILDILLDDIAGQQAIAYYKDNKDLNDFFRKSIIKVLVDHFIQSKIWIEKRQFTDITNEILKIFKSANPDAHVSKYTF